MRLKRRGIREVSKVKDGFRICEHGRGADRIFYMV